MATLNFPVGISQCILSMGIAHIEPSWNFSVTSGKVSLNLSWDQVNTGTVLPGPPPGMKPIQVHNPKPQNNIAEKSRPRNYTAPRFNKFKTARRSDYDVQWRKNSPNPESHCDKTPCDSKLGEIDKNSITSSNPDNDNLHVSDSIVSVIDIPVENTCGSNEDIIPVSTYQETQVSVVRDSTNDNSYNGEFTTLYSNKSGIDSVMRDNSDEISDVSQDSDDITSFNGLAFNTANIFDNYSPDCSGSVDSDDSEACSKSEKESLPSETDMSLKPIPHSDIGILSTDPKAVSCERHVSYMFIQPSVLNGNSVDKDDSSNTKYQTAELVDNDNTVLEIPIDMYSLTECEDESSLDKWKTHSIKYLSQFPDFVPFLEGMEWEVDVTYSRNNNRGLSDIQMYALEAMLSEIANNCPDSLYNKILKFSTSIHTVWNSIFLKYGVVSDT